MVTEWGTKCSLASKWICILETSPSTTDDPWARRLWICVQRGLPTSCTGRTPRNNLEAFKSPTLETTGLASWRMGTNELLAGSGEEPVWLPPRSKQEGREKTDVGSCTLPSLHPSVSPPLSPCDSSLLKLISFSLFLLNTSMHKYITTPCLVHSLSLYDFRSYPLLLGNQLHACTSV